MTSFIAESGASLVISMTVALSLAFIPLDAAKTGRRATILTLFLVAGLVIVLVSDSADWLRGAFMLLTGGLLLLGEFAAAGNPGRRMLVDLLWIVCGVVGIWKWSSLGAWVGAHRPWVLTGAVLATILLLLMASRRRRIAIDRYTMRGM
ncbi:hypothetical protein Lesp02_20150 [Lentzea sp. NBRC 105346]|uniref:hypothetical protein n=1 Tax=Lentzea sp. NBRC 105346 TaxID=3032205 RepID=UPI0024A55D17|nr:hypothetical protein [Lentzea sp. NBRC 105346]GLZ29825.1 hypothetical protein Lesp02_20150 [Lentzea sp. NBRC 105346]